MIHTHIDGGDRAITNIPNTRAVGIGFLRISGLLWKINHDILHPLGLTLACTITDGEAAPLEDLSDKQLVGPLQLLIQFEPPDDTVGFPEDVDAERAERWDVFVSAVPFLRHGVTEEAARKAANGSDA